MNEYQVMSKETVPLTELCRASRNSTAETLRYNRFRKAFHVHRSLVRYKTILEKDFDMKGTRLHYTFIIFFT